MKTSKTQQDKTRRLLIRTAVDLMTEHGFDGTTMKQVARTAGIGDATIYKYFPTKEKLVLAYFEQAIADAIAQFRKTRGQDTFSLQERMQLLIDSLLEQLLPDREFVAVARDMVRRMPLLLAGEALPGKALLKAEFAQMLEQAEANDEIAPCGFKPSLSALLADGVYGVADHWLQDTSDGFGHTAQLVDMGLAVLVLALHSGLVDKLLELAGFLLRSQLTRLLQSGSGLIDGLQLLRRGFEGARR